MKFKQIDKPFEFLIRRSKFGNNEILSLNILKKKIIREKGDYCEVCKSKDKLELEHIIPVFLAGKMADESNLRILCKKCHLKKTIKDKVIINCFKSLKFIKRTLNGNVSFIAIEDLHQLYSLLFDKMNELDKIVKDYESWDIYVEKERYCDNFKI